MDEGSGGEYETRKNPVRSRKYLKINGYEVHRGLLCDHSLYILRHFYFLGKVYGVYVGTFKVLLGYLLGR